MTEAWRSDGSGLDTLPWHVFSLDASRPDQDGGYLVKGVFHQDSGYHVMLFGTLASSIWEEKLDPGQILQRLKKLNPKVESPLPILLSTLSAHLESHQSDATYSLSPTTPTSATPSPPDLLTLDLQTTLASLPLKWKFELKKCSNSKLSEQVVVPLLGMVGELMRRQQELHTILSQKDREIQDYRDQGHKVSRKYLETGSFSVSEFEKEMTESPSFAKSAQTDMEYFCSTASQQLYVGMVTSKRNMLEAKTTDPDGTEHAQLSTADPASVMEVSDPSPLKRTLQPSADETKDTEQWRREELERKLEESKSKPKKKKKKLM